LRIEIFIFVADAIHSYWAVFTIDATTPQLAAESYSVIGKIGGLEGTESSGKYFLSQVRDPWLLIIDNVDSHGIHLPKLLPPGNRGHVLVTTRNRDSQEYGNVGSMELGGLEKEEALYLLLKSARISTPWDISIETAANEVTKTLGYLALAVKQAGTAISQKLCNLTEYLGFYQYYRKKRQRASTIPGTISVETSSGSRQDDVYSAFDLSFDYLEGKQTVESQDAISILNIVSFYHFRNIRVDIFERALKNRQSFTAPTFKEALDRRLRPPALLPRFLRRGAADAEPLYVRAVLRELYMCSLINYEEGARGFYLHPLVHSWARDRIHQSQRTLWAHVALNTLLESVSLPLEEAKETDSHFPRDIIPHLEECIAACPVEIKAPNSRLGRFGVVCLNLILPTMRHILRGQALTAAKCGYLYAQSGRFAQSAYYLSMVKDLTVQTMGYNNGTTQKAVLFLADILWGLGQLEDGITMQRQVVKVRTEHLGASHRETLQAMAKLGHSFWLNGQYVESLRVLEDTAQTSSEALGPKHLDTLTALDHLGVTLGSWQRYRESKALHERVLEVRKHTLGEDNLETLMTMSNLAMAMLDLEQREQAQQMINRVYEVRREKLGKEHPYTLWSLCYLSKALLELGHLDDAENMLVGGIAAGKRSIGDEHLGVLMGYGELARVYARQGRLDEAEELTLRTLRSVKETRGIEHFDYIFGMWKLGQLYELQKKVARAVDTYHIALENAGPRLTKEHPLSKQIEMRIIELGAFPLPAHDKSAGIEDECY
jgi:tetratricopeptide (TPR) repeat protein